MSSKATKQAVSRIAMQAGHGNAICYSGYREGQSPQAGVFPSYAEISEDLNILAKNWKFLRLYDCSPHAETVLEVIRNEDLDFKIMLGMDVAAEMSNPHCPWGAEFSDETLTANAQA
ncbi:MAG: glycosyl hydrolase, partial [Gammaproteobacteria bacterium]